MKFSEYVYQTPEQFKAANNAVGLALRASRRDFDTHVRRTLFYFLGNGSKNTGIIKSLLDAAVAGLSRNEVSKLTGYIQAAIPRIKITTKVKDRRLVVTAVEAQKNMKWKTQSHIKWIGTNPIWHDWGKQESKAEVPAAVKLQRAIAMTAGALVKSFDQMNDSDWQELLNEIQAAAKVKAHPA